MRLIGRTQVSLVCFGARKPNYNNKICLPCPPDQTIWPSISPSCSGTEQSPIDIQRAKIRINESLAIEMLNYDRPHAGYSVVNNGHSIQFNYIGDKSTAPTITGTALNGDKYLLAQLHSHWGSRKGEGSEHTIDGLAYSLEVCFVLGRPMRMNN